MEEQSHQTITLVRAGQAVDLWAAIETAQYGYLLSHDDPRSPAEDDALQRFANLFSEVTEAWEDTSAENQQSLIHILEPALDDLSRAELHVHHGMVERELLPPEGEAVTVPLAVINLGRDGAPKLLAQVPLQLAAEEEEDDDE